MNSEKICHETNASKNYEEGFVFLVTETLKDIRNYSLKLAKMF